MLCLTSIARYGYHCLLPEKKSTVVVAVAVAVVAQARAAAFIVGARSAGLHPSAAAAGLSGSRLIIVNTIFARYGYHSVLLIHNRNCWREGRDSNN